jgi:hypothetical protein
MVVGAFVRGLSMRDVESLCEEAGLGKQAQSTPSFGPLGLTLRKIAAAAKLQQL